MIRENMKQGLFLKFPLQMVTGKNEERMTHAALFSLPSSGNILVKTISPG